MCYLQTEVDAVEEVVFGVKPLLQSFFSLRAARVRLFVFRRLRIMGDLETLPSERHVN